MNTLKRASWWTALLAAIAFPLLLVPFNLRLLVHNLSFYQVEFQRYGIERLTGFTEDELLGSAQALMDYFDSNTEPFSYRLRDGREVYNPREVAHLQDVKKLLRLGDGVMWAAALVLVSVGAIQLTRAENDKLQRIGRPLAIGALATLGLPIGVGLLSLSDFSGAFLQFHYLAFSNDLWQLDPRTDNLIRMFPEGFFLDATLLVALATVTEALLLLALGLLLHSKRPIGEKPKPQLEAGA